MEFYHWKEMGMDLIRVVELLIGKIKSDY